MANNPLARQRSPYILEECKPSVSDTLRWKSVQVSYRNCWQSEQCPSFPKAYPSDNRCKLEFWVVDLEVRH